MHTFRVTHCAELFVYTFTSRRQHVPSVRSPSRVRRRGGHLHEFWCWELSLAADPHPHRGRIESDPHKGLERDVDLVQLDAEARPLGAHQGALLPARAAAARRAAAAGAGGLAASAAQGQSVRRPLGKRRVRVRVRAW